ncbi:MAG TPA: SDR family NAD(P)-dependent oxidoreductase [Myxococcaceae bacterium]|nr:SDR family NAD(P)-dependent oxidoreductase [Myxococcaceae bacterium]
MTAQLQDKVALVTGASSGIGEATALALARAGARVAIAARRRERLDGVAGRIADLRSESLVLEADLARPEEAESIVARTVDRWGRLDVLVNNAGVMLLSPVDRARVEDWRRMLDLNLLGLMAATRAALPHMRRQKDGHVVNISSTAGRVANPDASVYAATKFGVGAFSEALRREVYQDNIRVTIVEPGAVATELREHVPDPDTRERIDTWARSLRQLQSEDVAAAILYAVSQPPHVNVNEILLRPTDQER